MGTAHRFMRRTSNMAKCPKCGVRKGKRPCQPLGAAICSLCCGEHRMRDIDCNEDCPFLEAGEEWQRDRQMARAYHKGRDYVRERWEAFKPRGASEPDFDMVTFCMDIESGIHLFHRNHPRLLDSDVLTALEGVRMSYSPVSLPPSARNPLEEALLSRLERATQGKDRRLSSDDRRQCTEAVMASVKRHASGNPDSTRYLEFIAPYFSELPMSMLEPDSGKTERKPGSLLWTP
jgi:hypothetical protein